MPDGTPEQLHAFNELQRITTSPENAARIVSGFNTLDVRWLAPQVRAPTLVLHATADLRIPFEEGRLLASLIPGARFVPLESRNHVLLEHEPAWPQFLAEVNAFLQAPGGSPKPRHASTDQKLSQASASAASVAPTRLDRRTTLSSALPVQPTSFIGRADELAAVRQLLLAEPGCQLLTLVGPGGIGKTRLAVQAAGQVEDALPDGVHFVSLASVNDARFIVAAIAEALQVNLRGEVAPKTSLLNFLRDRELLLVVDNFEHVLEGAQLLAEILNGSRWAMLLVTSRERLNLQEEWVYEVPGLEWPAGDSPTAPLGPESLRRFSAVELFLERARQTRAGFTLTPEDTPHLVRICRLVDGMPLGLELAAPWVRSMSLREIAAEIERSLDFLTTPSRNVPERHRSLRLVLEQAWERLSRAEQEALCRLSVFQGGCQREAAAAVSGAPSAVVASLVDRALLRRAADGRFEMHPLVQQFAAEQLRAVPVEADRVRDRHADHFMAFLHARTADVKGARQKEALASIAAEVDNVRAAWRRAVERKDANALEQAAECLWLFCEFRGLLGEGETALHQAAAAFAPEGRTDKGSEGLAGFLVAGQGSLCARQGRFAEGRALMEHGIGLLRQADRPDRQKEAFALAWLGFNCVIHARYDEAEQFARAGLALFAQTGDQWTKAGCLRLLGAAAVYRGRLREADQHLQECLAACRAIGERRIQTYALLNLGIIARTQGRYVAARQFLDEGLTFSRELGDPLSRIALLDELGRLLVAQGEIGQAVQVLHECLAISRETGHLDESWILSYLAEAFSQQGDLAQAEHAYQESLALSRPAGILPNIASCLSGLGDLAYRQAQYLKAEQLQEEALALWKKIGHEPEMAGVLGRLGRAVAASSQARALEAGRHYAEALELALRQGLAPVALDVLAGLARLWSQAGRAEQAVELLALAEHHEASTYETRQDVRQQLEALAAGLRDGQLDSAMARSRTLDWRSLAGQIVAERSGID